MVVVLVSEFRGVLYVLLYSTCLRFAAGASCLVVVVLVLAHRHRLVDDNVHRKQPASCQGFRV